MLPRPAQRSLILSGTLKGNVTAFDQELTWPTAKSEP